MSFLVCIPEGSGDYFSLDHLFIDQDGIPTLVEVKRSTDTRFRREVIGQMLEYAANASAFWSAERLRAVFERRCEKAALDPEIELQALDTAGTVSSDEIWEKVSSNLRQERLRLVFIADKFAPETQRIIEFLNRQMQLTEVYAVEVPRVLNPSVLQADRRVVASGVGEMWTTDRFYQDVLERHGEVAVKIFRQIGGKLDGSIQITYKRRCPAVRESIVRDKRRTDDAQSNVGSANVERRLGRPGIGCSPDLSKLKVVGLTSELAESYAPMNITVSYAERTARPSRF